MGAQSSTFPARIRIAVSACLLGERVRYDAEDKRSLLVMNLAEEFELLSFCPEVAIGLSVPRPPVQLVMTERGIRARGLLDPMHDISERLETHAQIQCEELKTCAAIIFKSRSPSCGLGSTPVFDQQGHEVGNSYGLFAAVLQKCLPGVLMVEESTLLGENDVIAFSEQLRASV